jgi:hypothetical protein
MFLVSYTGMLGKALGVSWQHHGPLGKVERLTGLMVFALVQFLVLPGDGTVGWLGLTATPIEWAMGLFVLLGQITVVKRLRGQLREMARKEASERLSPLRNRGRAVVVYDSATGNTEKVARQIAAGLRCDAVPLADAPDLSRYEMLVLGSPNIRGGPTTRLSKMPERVTCRPGRLAVFATYGMPLWGQISAPSCLKSMADAWGMRPAGRFTCKGFHNKYKTYKGRPNDEDLLSAFLFGLRLSRLLERPVRRSSDEAA